MGFHEPHRGYELNSGVRLGKKLKDVKVPAYLPDNDIVRGDLPTTPSRWSTATPTSAAPWTCWKQQGVLENTLIIVTSDHGMPFPRVKGQIYEDGFHLPLAMRWGKGIKPGRVVEDFINVRDFAPTYLELAGLPRARADDRQEPRQHPPQRRKRLRRKPQSDARRQGAPRHRPPERLGLSRARHPHAPSSSTSTTTTPSAGPPAIPRPTSATATTAPPSPGSSKTRACSTTSPSTTAPRRSSTTSPPIPSA